MMNDECRMMRAGSGRQIGAMLLVMFIGILAIPGRAWGQATMNFAITNSDGTPYSGPLWIYPIRWQNTSAPILADGSFFIGGVVSRIALTNSLGSAPLMQGPYFASNSVAQFTFATPLSIGTFNAASNV